MSEIDLAAIRARSDAATPGPWRAFHHATEAEVSYVGADGHAVAEVRHVADAEFIAHARTDVPALLARIAELEADLSDAHHEGFGVGMESADRDIDQIATAAERRGYERAVARLRDHNAFLGWLHDNPPTRTMSQSVLAAAYLDAVKESTDG